MNFNQPNYNFQTLFSQVQSLSLEYRNATDVSYKNALSTIVNVKLSTLQTLVHTTSANQLRQISSITISYYIILY